MRMPSPAVGGVQAVLLLKFSPLMNWAGEPAEGNALASVTYQKRVPGWG